MFLKYELGPIEVLVCPYRGKLFSVEAPMQRVYSLSRHFIVICFHEIESKSVCDYNEPLLH